MAATQMEPVARAAIVADDSALIRDTVRSALGAPWRVFVAANGVEALEYARTMRAQLILLDVRMPRMDGIDACSRIRLLPHCADVPIVMLTAYDDTVVRHRARRAGATSVFAKPFTFEGLRAGIAPLLTASQNAARVAEAREMVERPSERPPLDGSGPIGDQAALDVCRRVEAAAEDRGYVSFAAAVEALRDAARR